MSNKSWVVLVCILKVFVTSFANQPHHAELTTMQHSNEAYQQIIKLRKLDKRNLRCKAPHTTKHLQTRNGRQAHMHVGTTLKHV